MNATRLVVIAYGVVWSAVLTYVVILARRQAALRRDLAELRKRAAASDATRK